MQSRLTDQITNTDEGMRVWQQERVIFEITERLCELMEEHRVSRSELAKRLRCSRGRVTQMLDGTRNMTIRTVSDLFWALGHQFHGMDRPLSTAGRESHTRTFRVYTGLQEIGPEPPEAEVRILSGVG